MKGVAAHLFHTHGVELVDVGDPAAQNHRIRIQNRNQASQTAAEIIQKLFEGRTALGISLPVALGDLLKGEPPAGVLEKGLCHTAAADFGFHAAPVATVTARPFRIHGEVAPLSGDEMLSAVDFSPDADATPAAGAYNNAEHQMIALAGTLPGLGQGKAVGVVFHGNGPAQVLLQILLERMADESGRIGVLHPPALDIDGAGDADADGAGCPMGHFAQARFDQRVDPVADSGVLGGAVRIAWRGRAFPSQADALGIQQNGFDFGAAQVDAQAVGVFGGHGFIRFWCCDRLDCQDHQS